jgi:hypothetical protein
MVMSLHAGWDFSRIGPFSMEVREGGAPQTATISTGKFAHLAIGSGYSLFATQLKSTLDATSLAGVFTVTYSAATNRYTISSTVAFRITAITPGTSVASQLIGLSADEGVTALSRSSTRDVWYSVPAVTDGREDDSDVREPPGISSDAVANDGTHYGVSRVTSPKERDFTLAFNGKTRTFRNSETATLPFSLERFMEHTRVSNAFGVYDSITTTGTTHFHRADGANFAPRRRIANNDLYWDWPFKTRQVGTF